MEVEIDGPQLSPNLDQPHNEAVLRIEIPPATDVPPLTLVDLLQSSSPSIDFSNPSAAQYVDQLLSLSLHELLRQPQLISAEASTVESDLTNLCFREYPTFISVHKCSSAVSSAFDDFSGSLGKLIGAIPSLEDECRSFSTSTGSIQNVRSKAALVQEHQDKLLDLLELPQLMETCVRNGYYQEAMELLNHCHSLKQKHPSNALVQDVNREVEGILQLMLAQLLALLREPVKLPALVKTVSFLRRLDAMDEAELGLVFISSRYHNFRSQLLSIDRDRVESVRYLRKYIDLFREHVYDIIAQFSAIFLETSPSEIAAIHITSFANQAISDLVDLVSTYIPRISSDSGSMSSILVQLGYCAMSFSRLGLDFAPLISAPFTSTVLSTFSQTLATTSNDFSSILRDSAKAVLPPSQILVVPEHIPHIVSSPTSPPTLPSIDSISHFPPIATLINAYLTAFNNLRLLAPLELHSQLISIHSSSLLLSTNVLLQYVTQATTLSDDPPMSPVKARPGHGRTASAPRADLLRRNSEVLMTPEARAAKRREARRVCVASADVWCRMVVPFLVEKLNDGVFADIPKPKIAKDLADKLDELERWIQANGEGLGNGSTINGDQTTDEPRTPPRRAQQLPSSPIAFGSPFRSQTSAPAIPNLPTPAPKSTPVPPTPHAEGIDAVFESPQPLVLTPDNNTSSVPEPASLRESDRDTVENMETQLEAMNIGLSGEEAAVAVEIKHATPHHHSAGHNNPKSRNIISAGPLLEKTPEPSETIPNGVAEVPSAVVEDTTPESEVISTQESTMNEESDPPTATNAHNVLETALEETSEEKDVIQNNKLNGDEEISQANVDEDASETVVKPIEPRTATKELDSPAADLDVSNDVAQSSLTDAQVSPKAEAQTNEQPIDVDGLPEPNGHSIPAADDPTPSLANDNEVRAAAEAIDSVLSLPDTSDSNIQDEASNNAEVVEEITPATLDSVNSIVPDEETSITEDRPAELPSAEPVTASLTPHPPISSSPPDTPISEITPDNAEEPPTPTSANPSRPVSPDDEAKPSTTATNTTGGASKKKKKKKGKK